MIIYLDTLPYSRVAIHNQLDYDVMSIDPTVLVDGETTFNHIFDAIVGRTEPFKIEAIVGVGLGGYFALWVASVLRVPVITFDHHTKCPGGPLIDHVDDIMPSYIPCETVEECSLYTMTDFSQAINSFITKTKIRG